VQVAGNDKRTVNITGAVITTLPFLTHGPNKL
jgi:hypothetical protein